MQRSLIEQSARINAQAFGPDDEYSQLAALLKPNHRLLVQNDGGIVSGYSLLRIEQEAVRCLRLATHRACRRGGIALKLLRRSIRVARKLGIPYRTYVAAHNVASLNLHAKAGARFERASYSEGSAWIEIAIW